MAIQSTKALFFVASSFVVGWICSSYVVSADKELRENPPLNNDTVVEENVTPPWQPPVLAIDSLSIAKAQHESSMLEKFRPIGNDQIVRGLKNYSVGEILGKDSLNWRDDTVPIGIIAENQFFFQGNHYRVLILQPYSESVACHACGVPVTFVFYRNGDLYSIVPAALESGGYGVFGWSGEMSFLSPKGNEGALFLMFFYQDFNMGTDYVQGTHLYRWNSFKEKPIYMEPIFGGDGNGLCNYENLKILDDSTVLYSRSSIVKDKRVALPDTVIHLRIYAGK